MPACPNCNYKHRFWDASLMNITHINSKPFIKITGCHYEEVDNRGFEITRIAHLYSCPQCHMVFWREN